MNSGFNKIKIFLKTIALDLNVFKILAQDIPGWLVRTEGGLTVALVSY